MKAVETASNGMTFPLKCLSLILVSLFLCGNISAQEADLTSSKPDLYIDTNLEWIAHGVEIGFDVYDVAVLYLQISNSGSESITIESVQNPADLEGFAILGPVTTDVLVPCDDMGTCTIEPNNKGHQMPEFVVGQGLVSSYLVRGHFSAPRHIMLPGSDHLFALALVTTTDKVSVSPFDLELRISSGNGDDQIVKTPIEIMIEEGTITLKMTR